MLYNGERQESSVYIKDRNLRKNKAIMQLKSTFNFVWF